MTYDEAKTLWEKADANELIALEAVKLATKAYGNAVRATDAAFAMLEFLAIKHIEQENQIELVEDGHPTGVEWYWDAISAQTRSYSFNAENIVNDTKANMRIAFIQQIETIEHEIEIYVNNNHFSTHLFHPPKTVDPEFYPML